MTLIWFLCALLPAAFWALSNIFDQYVTRHYCADSPSSFVAIAGIASGPVAILLLPFVLQETTLLMPFVAGLSMIAALFFSLALWPYFYALAAEDAHAITPLIQINIFIVAVLAWIFLDETLTLVQLVGGTIMFLAATLSMRPQKTIKWPLRPILYILAAAFSWALFNFLLRLIPEYVHWSVVTFWICIAWCLLSLVLCASGSRRREVIRILRLDHGRAFGLNFIQQVGDIGAATARAVALSFAVVPAAITVVIGGGTHPFFALLFGFLAARLVPSVYTFTLTRRDVAYKLLCFAVMMAGLWLVVGQG